jgi:hypothetical protein
MVESATNDPLRNDSHRADNPGKPEIEDARINTAKKWCSGGDLNPHALRHAPLKRTCLPFHHPSFASRNI